MKLDRHDTAPGSPRHALVLAISGPYTEAHVPMRCPAVRSGIVFFESGKGGAVLSVGSIAYSSALSHNGYANNIARRSENTLRRFLDERPFPD